MKKVSATLCHAIASPVYWTVTRLESKEKWGKRTSLAKGREQVWPREENKSSQGKRTSLAKGREQVWPREENKSGQGRMLAHLHMPHRNDTHDHRRSNWEFDQYNILIHKTKTNKQTKKQNIFDNGFNISLPVSNWILMCWISNQPSPQRPSRTDNAKVSRLSYRAFQLPTGFTKQKQDIHIHTSCR